LETKKNCEFCGARYVPKNSQYKTQKYCTKSCKDRAYRKRESLKDKPRKGGYPRRTYLKLWMKARNEDFTVPCHYCSKRLYPDDFCIDHKVAIKFLKTREEITDESNLVISCWNCNHKKGSMSYTKFLKLKEKEYE